MQSPDERLPGWRRVALTGIKMLHAVAFFSIGSCLLFFAYSALTKRSDRGAAIAGAVVAGEAAAGLRARLGAGHLPAARGGGKLALRRRADLRGRDGVARAQPVARRRKEGSS